MAAGNGESAAEWNHCDSRHGARHNLRLITSDDRIISSGLVPVIT